MKSRRRGEGRKQRGRGGRPAAVGLELLEPRQLFSATLWHGIWRIMGDGDKSNYNDQITVALNATTQQFELTINGVMVQSRPTAGVRRIVIRGGLGNDSINVDAVGSSVDVWVYGGRGNDRIIGSEGRNVLRGEAGDDDIDGGDGNDLIEGGAGADHLDGGAGDDALYGDSGEDVVVAGAGTNKVRGGRGADMLYGVVGRDAIGKDRTDVFVDAENRYTGGDPILPGPFYAPVTYTGTLRQRLIDEAVARSKNLFGKVYDPTPLFIMGGAGSIVPIQSQGGASVTFNINAAGAGGADIAATDGNYLYILRSQQLVIVDMRDPARSRIVSITSVGGDTGSGLYLNNGHLVIVATHLDHRLGNQIAEDLFNGNPQRLPSTSVLVFDLSDPAVPTVLERTDFSGSLASSHMVGDQLALVFNNTLHVPEPRPVVATGEAPNAVRYQTEAEYRQWLNVHLDAYLPAYTATTGDPSAPVRGSMLEPMQYTGSGELRDFTTVATLDVADGMPGLVSMASVTGRAGTVYAAGTNLYVMRSHVPDAVVTNIPIVPFLATDVLKFNLGAQAVQLEATGVLDGLITSPTLADEWNGQLRVVTQTSTFQSFGHWRVTSRLAVLTAQDGVLSVTGELNDFSGGQSLRSARFIEGRFFAATSDTLSSLLAIDLSDAVHPAVAGKIVTTNSISYLLPLDRNHLVGIGTGQGGIIGAVQASLFDVTDLAHALAVEQVPDSKVWAFPLSGLDPRSISYFADTGTLAIPVINPVVSSAGSASNPPNGLLIFHVDPTLGTSQLGQVTFDSAVQRTLKVGENLVSLAQNDFKFFPLTQPDHGIADVILPPIKFHFDSWYAPLPFSIISVKP